MNVNVNLERLRNEAKRVNISMFFPNRNLTPEPKFLLNGFSMFSLKRSGDSNICENHMFYPILFSIKSYFQNNQMHSHSDGVITLPPTKKVRDCAWKKLYIQRDEEDMVEFVRDCPAEFKEYYIQMQVAKRSQAPLPSQVKDDTIILDKTVADQVSIWKRSKGLTDKVFLDHDCSGDRCYYFQIGEVFVCETTRHVHVCDDTCKEVILDPTNELLVCTISAHCFDRLLSPGEMEPYSEQQQCGAADGVDEAEPFMGSGRFARAYILGYNCHDEKELEAAFRFC